MNIKIDRVDQHAGNKRVDLPKKVICITSAPTCPFEKKELAHRTPQWSSGILHGFGIIVAKVIGSFTRL